MARNIVFDLAARFGAQGAEMVAGSLDKIHKSTKGAMKGFQGIGEAFGHLQRAATGLAIIGAGVAGVLGKMSKSAMDFEHQMAVVASVVNPDGKFGGDMRKLESLARKMGLTTFSSATEAAKGMEVLAKAGFDAREIAAALPGVLALAATEEMKVEKAADIATKTMKAFGLEAKEMTRVADVLAFVSMKTATDVKGLGAAMPYVAGQAKMLGMSYDETAMAMGLMTNAGIANTRAGTVLAAFLQHITGAARRGTKEIKQLGLQLTATSSYTDKLTGKKIKKGDFIGLFGALEQITGVYDRKGDSVVKRTQFFTRALGLQGVRMTSLIPGFKAYREKYEEYVKTSAKIARGEMDTSFAFQMATMRFKSTRGAVTLLKNAFEGFSVSLWKANIFTPQIAAGLTRVTQVIRTAAALLGDDPDKNDIVKKIGLKPESVAKVQKIVDGIKRGINEFGLFIQDIYRKVSERLGKSVFGMNTEEIAAKVTKVVLALGLLGPAIFALIPVAMVLGGVFQAFTSTIAVLAGPAGLIIGLGVALIWLMGKMSKDKPEGFFNTMKSGFKELNDFATPVVKRLGEEISGLVSSMGSLSSKTTEINQKHTELGGTLTKQKSDWEMVKWVAGGALNIIITALGTVMRLAVTIGEGLAIWFGKGAVAISGIWNMVTAIFTNNTQAMEDGFKKFIYGVMNMFGQFALGMLKGSANIVDGIGRMVGKDFGAAKKITDLQGQFQSWSMEKLNLKFQKDAFGQDYLGTPREQVKERERQKWASRSFGPGAGYGMAGFKPVTTESDLDALLYGGATSDRGVARMNKPRPAQFSPSWSMTSGMSDYGTGSLLMRPETAVETGTAAVREATRPRAAATAGSPAAEMATIMAQSRGEMMEMAQRAAKEAVTNITINQTNQTVMDGRVLQQEMQKLQFNDAARSGGRPGSNSAATPTVGLSGRQGAR